MTDTISRERRSEIMSKIQGGLDRNSIERRVHNWLKGNRIRHEMQPKIVGNPDVYLKDIDIYLFLDGCFWHCCPKHYRRPKSNQEFWIPHIEESNRKREKKRKKLSYRWVRIWEHDIRNGAFKDVITALMGDGNAKI